MRRNLYEQKKNMRNYVIKTCSILVLWVIVISLLSSFFYSVGIMREKLQILDMVEEDAEELRMENLRLILERGEIISYEYIEKEARDKLRYSRDGDMLFVIPEGLLESAWLGEALRKAKGLEDVYPYKTTDEMVDIWVDFLFVSGT